MESFQDDLGLESWKMEITVITRFFSLDTRRYAHHFEHTVFEFPRHSRGWLFLYSYFRREEVEAQKG